MSFKLNRLARASARLKKWRHGVAIWFNAILLTAFPFTDQIVQGVNDYLPSFAPYLPANVYKVVGFLVVVFNMVRAMQKARRAAQAKAVANG